MSSCCSREGDLLAEASVTLGSKEHLGRPSGWLKAKARGRTVGRIAKSWQEQGMANIEMANIGMANKWRKSNKSSNGDSTELEFEFEIATSGYATRDSHFCS